MLTGYIWYFWEIYIKETKRKLNLHTKLFQETYETFHYTSLLYLNDYDKDFKGGRFMFIDKNNVNMTVEPRKGKKSTYN